jgi:hypothetical protein
MDEGVTLLPAVFFFFKYFYKQKIKAPERG